MNSDYHIGLTNSTMHSRTHQKQRINTLWHLTSCHSRPKHVLQTSVHPICSQYVHLYQPIIFFSIYIIFLLHLSNVARMCLYHERNTKHWNQWKINSVHVFEPFLEKPNKCFTWLICEQCTTEQNRLLMMIHSCEWSEGQVQVISLVCCVKHHHVWKT